MGNMLIQLADKKKFVFKDARGAYIECSEGVIWLTVEGQPGDFLLSKGERVRIESNGLAMVQGFLSGTVRLIYEATGSMRRVNHFDWHMGRTASSSPARVGE